MEVFKVANPIRSGGRILKRWVKLAMNADVFGLASQVAYDMVFLLGPGLLFLTGMLSLFGNDPGILRGVVDFLKAYMPSNLHSLIDQQVAGIVLTGGSGTVATIGILLGLYLGVNLITTISRALNACHGSARGESFVSKYLIAVLLLFWFCVAIVGSFNTMVFGERLAMALEEMLNLQIPLQQWVSALKFPLSTVALTAVALALYLLAPEVHLSWKQAIPGALFFAIGWLIVTQFFRIYVDKFAKYNEFYLALATFIILMVWAYFTALFLLLGGALNEVLREKELEEPPVDPDKTDGPLLLTNVSEAG